MVNWPCFALGLFILCNAVANHNAQAVGKLFVLYTVCCVCHSTSVFDYVILSSLLLL